MPVSNGVILSSQEDIDIYGIDRTYRTVRNDGSSVHPLRHSKDSLDSTPNDGHQITAEKRRDTWYRRGAGMTDRVATEQRTSKVKDTSRSRHHRVDIESGVDAQKNATIKLGSEEHPDEAADQIAALHTPGASPGRTLTRRPITDTAAAASKATPMHELYQVAGRGPLTPLEHSRQYRSRAATPERSMAQSTYSKDAFSGNKLTKKARIEDALCKYSKSLRSRSKDPSNTPNRSRRDAPSAHSGLVPAGVVGHRLSTVPAKGSGPAQQLLHNIIGKASKHPASQERSRKGGGGLATDVASEVTPLL